MLDNEPDTSTEGQTPSPAHEESAPSPHYDESITEEVGALLEDAQLYATAELAFQKTRAKLVGKNVGIAAGAIIVAILLLNIALIALAVGFVIALAPLVTIWGAIALVVGALLAGVALLGAIAMKRGQMIGEMFATEKAPGTSSENTSKEDG
ncbi:MAG: hypothetical protein AAF553_12370 [Pseudomonadota bacterium]